MRTPATLRSFPGPIELIHAHAGPGLLALARLGLILLWIVKLLLDPLWRLGELPLDLIRPAGVLAFVAPEQHSFFWSGASLTLLWIVTLMVLVIALVNRVFLVAGPVAAVLLTIYSSVIHSFGPDTVHSEIVPLLAMYAFALFGFADFIQRRLHRGALPNASAPLIAIVTFLCLTYSLVGLNRVFASFPVFLGNSMEIWTIDASLRAYYFNTEIGWHLPQWPLLVFFLRVGLPVITLFEIAAPFCLVSPWFRRVFIPVMIAFHLLSLVLMNIFFFEDVVLYLLLIDWSKRFPALRSR